MKNFSEANEPSKYGAWEWLMQVPESTMGRLFRYLLVVLGLLLSNVTYAAESHRIISRAEWGADESFLYTDTEESSSVDNTTKTSEPDTISQRQKDCSAWQEKYPEEFKVERTVKENGDGKRYRWTQQFSPSVKLIVVHHTALAVTGDERTPAERMRALYQMHANGNGWGDIGYHYVIAEDGSIFEGKSGGPSIVGGHVFCSNVGTLGISLMGNFEIEKPTQAQMRALQWLSGDLMRRYHIDPRGRVKFHGKDLPTMVGHKDILSTDCPGYYVAETMGQIRSNVATNNINAAIRFPTLARTDRTPVRREQRIATAQDREPRLAAVGSTTLIGRPGDSALFRMTLMAGQTSLRRRSRIASVSRSNNRIGLFQKLGARDVPVRTELLLPEDLGARQSTSIDLHIDFPTEAGSYTLTIGTVRYMIMVEGRRTRTVNETSTEARPQESTTTMRIRLSSKDEGIAACADVDLIKLRTQYRGTVRCETIDGKPVIINTLLLEEYLQGLAEEPDTEPFEKQRAFAIAARSYAMFYTDPLNRKFPGMPYDGDDSPARFQAYGGIAFELRNPNWVRAVRSTANQVLTVDDAVIKVPYFSSDDGRTRSPDEAGWKNFPHAEIFSSKPDPWCTGMKMAGHGVGMSGCGSEAQALEGKKGEEILGYYYPGALIRER